MALVQLAFSTLNLKILKSLVSLQDVGVNSYPWTDVSQVTLSATVQRQVADICDRIAHDRPQLMNEATVWARAIYPLLMLAEQDVVRAWAQVSLQATYPAFELYGVVDGALGKGLAGELEAPYLVVVEAKRGVDAKNPQYQLYGAMLAAARLNWELDGHDPQTIFGCYTVADVWTFVRGVVAMEGDGQKPSLYLESSQEYTSKLEAETIVKILKQIMTETLAMLKTAA